MKYILLLIGLLLSHHLAFSQFVAKRSVKANVESTRRANINRTNFYDLTNSLPKKHVKDGSVDYTKYIQKGLDSHRYVIMPNFPVLVTGVYVNSNSKVFFGDRSKLIMKPTVQGRYRVLGLHGVQNVKIYNPTIIGDRTKHLGKEGEWGYGIEIKASKDVEVHEPNISECWGDGIIITEAKSNMKRAVAGYSVNNIAIFGGILDYNRRNGITITSGSNVNVRKTTIINTMGAAPKAGIMIEPDNAQALLNNINVENVTISNCPLGIGINLTKFSNSSKGNSISLSIENTTIKNSLSGIQLAGYPKAPRKRKISGELSLNRISFLDNGKDLVAKNGFGLLPSIRLKELKIYKKGTQINKKDELLKNVFDKSKIILQ